jgi:hypothetical protein
MTLNLLKLTGAVLIGCTDLLERPAKRPMKSRLP